MLFLNILPVKSKRERAALTRRKDKIYQAAMLVPHTAAELTLDEIRNLCDELSSFKKRSLRPFDDFLKS